MDLNAWKQHSARLKAEYNHPDGSPCPVCNGSGHVMEVWSNDEYFHGLLTICPECGSLRVREDDARRAGNAPRYGDYMDNEAWQRTLHRKAGEFAQRPAGVFYIGGQTAPARATYAARFTITLWRMAATA